MRFSILIPVYNVRKYIEECLDSVMGQDYADFEVIIVDDGSTDGSGEICDRYQRNHPEQIRVIHKKNQGLISARRIGIANARGEFCVFVDSDDMIEFNLLSEVARSMDDNDNPDIVMYSFRYLRDGKPAEQYPHRFADGEAWSGEQKKELYTSLLSGPSIDALWIKAIRTSVLKADPIPYENYYSLNMSEDTLQSLYPLTAAKKVVFIDVPLYLYRIIDTSISHDFSVKSIEKKNTNHVYRTILEYLPIWELDDEDTRSKLKARWFHEAMYTFCRYYEFASDKRTREKILEFDWDTMIPFEVRQNRYFSKVYLKIYSSMKSKHKRYIKFYFLRKKIKKTWRALKSSK